MRRRKNKKPNLILLLLVVLGSLGIGYAFLTQELTINGVGNFTSSNWDVHFANLVPNTNITLAGTDSAATINQTTRTDITYQVTLVKPGDFYEFTVDVVNGGSLDAMIGEITNNLNGNPIGTGNELPAYARYTATYSDGKTIEPNHLLAANSSETFKVRLEYRTDINPSDLPGTQTPTTPLTFNFGVNYVQADSNATARPKTVIRYSANRRIGSYDNTVRINQAVPNDVILYTTPQEALAAMKTIYSKDFPFYFKHIITNNIVTDSYIEIIINETTKQNIINSACTNSSEYSTCEANVNNLNNGTYLLRGGLADYNGSYIGKYNKDNIAVAKQIFGDACETEYGSESTGLGIYCSAGLFININPNGLIKVSSGDVDREFCCITLGGVSSCELI